MSLVRSNLERGTVDLHHLTTSRADDAGLYAPLGHCFHSHQSAQHSDRSNGMELGRGNYQANLVSCLRNSHGSLRLNIPGDVQSLVCSRARAG